MPAEESTPAIVLRARDYADSDRIVTLLTRDLGKLSGIAKGAKASRYRFERKLEPFSHVVLHFRRRPHGQLVFITRAEAADLTQHVIDDDLAKIALGSYMLEMSDALTAEEGEAAEAYEVLTEGLGALSTRFADAALRHRFRSPASSPRSLKSKSTKTAKSAFIDSRLPSILALPSTRTQSWRSCRAD